MCDWKTALDGDKGVEGYHSHTASPRLFADVDPQNEVQITKLLALQRTTHRHTRVYIKCWSKPTPHFWRLSIFPAALHYKQRKQRRRDGKITWLANVRAKFGRKLCTRSVRRPEKDKGETQFHIRFFLFLLAVISLK